MRCRLLVAMAVATGCSAAFPVSASPQVSGDSVVGSGSGSGFVAGDQFEVSIQAGPSGENPTGFIRATGVVTPLSSTIATNPDPWGAWASGTFGFPQPDVLLRFGYPVAPPVDCPDPDVLPDPGSPFADLPIDGDVTVIDAQPLPTSRDQCANGGWKSYGVFRNRGDCVSFVATGGRNPPHG